MALKQACISVGAMALCLSCAWPAAAQTQIIPDTAPVVTTGTTADRAGTATIIDGGRRVGNNLFHSFAAFSLGTGETALWLRGDGDGASIANIINRVTGGAASSIDGTIATAGMDGANFFFINPAGIIFSENASVAVPNAAHFSTADNLRFADGAVFGVTTPGGSVFSMAPPTAFGFLGTQGNISINGVGPAFAGSDTKLSLSAANIRIDRAEFEPGGLDLFAVGAANRTLSLAAPLALRSASGAVTISDSFVTAVPSDRQDGRVRVNAGQLTVIDSIFASDSNARSAAGMQLLVGDLLVRGTPDSERITYLGSYARAAGNAATVDIDALRLFASGGSRISSEAEVDASGNAGDIRIRTNLLAMDSGARIVSSALGDSMSGSIAIVADRITMASDAFIETTTSGRGRGGDVTINTGSLDMDASAILAEAEFGASGNAGFINIAATRLSLDNGARISSTNRGSGTGGQVDITGDVITLRNSSRIEADAIGDASGGAGFVTVTGGQIRIESESEISSTTDGSGDAGAILIAADSLVIDSGRLISASLGGTGAAGFIAIDAGTLAMRAFGNIQTSTVGSGAAGSIDIRADSIAMASGAFIETTTFAAGRGGDVTIKAGSLDMNASAIMAEAEFGASGDAGFIDIASTRLTLDDGARISSTNRGSGIGGLVKVGGDTITLRNLSKIEADAVGTDSGGGGFIEVTARLLSIESGSEISAITDGDGNAGELEIVADSLIIDRGLLSTATGGGRGIAGFIFVRANSLALRNGGEITSTTAGSGAAGWIDIAARSISLSGESAITSETFGAGDAGSVLIGPRGGVAPDIMLSGESRIASAQVGPDATGNAGFVRIDANDITLGPATAAAISTSIDNGGLAGAIIINAKRLTLDGAEIASAARGSLAGSAGAIRVKADTLSIVNGGRIESTSFSPGPAGAIDLTVGTLVLRGAGSEITSENLSARGGLAGGIAIDAARIEILDGAAISTNSVAGPAGNISLTMPRTGTLLLRGARQSGVITTSSGPGTGGLITIASPYLILSDGGQILALGEEFGADVAIQSDFYIRSSDRLNLLSVDGSLLLDSEIGDLSTGAEQVDLSFLDASAVLRGQCAATRRSGTSQLNLRAIGPHAGTAIPKTSRQSPLSQLEVPIHCGK